MTTNKNLLDSNAPVFSPDQKADNIAIAKSITKNSNVVKTGGTLRGKLLTTILPTVLIPLIAASTIASNLVETRVKGEKVENIESQVVLSSLVTSQTLETGLNITDVMASDPFMLQQLKVGTQKVNNEGITNKSIDQIEKQFSATKLLKPRQDLNDYLRTIVKTRGIAEIIVTEKNGLNIAYNEPTSDFVQSDEQWWKTAAEEGATVLQPEFDESSQAEVIEIVNSINDPETGELLGVTKVGIDIATFNQRLTESLGIEWGNTQQIQIIDTNSGKAIDTLFSEEDSSISEANEIIGGEAIIQASRLLSQFTRELESEANEGENDDDDEAEEILEELERQVAAIAGISDAEFESEEEEEYVLSLGEGEEEGEQEEEEEAERNILSLVYEDKFFHLKTVPNTNFVVISSIDQEELARAGKDVRNILYLITAGIGVLAIATILLLARNLSRPLANLTDKAQQVAQGDLNVKADLEGTQETRTLAQNFNNLVRQVKDLIKGQEAIASEQKQEKERLELEIYQLLDEIQGAADGDLTVRASLESMEMSTVADLFNAVIDSLQDIAVQVKDSSNQVGTSLTQNEQSIKVLAQQAVQEAEETRTALDEIEQMSQSIEEVANNANYAATLAEDAYEESQEGTTAMDETVNSIVSLRSTVGETAQKMKRLGESSQKIAQIVSLIEEIALKTNLLAINASRTGAQGQDFNVFGEQLASLGEQSAAATKQIAQIANEIRVETQEVSEAMAIGNSQADSTTRLVETTKQRLAQVVDTSRNINELMRSISQATVSQNDTSSLVTQLMQKIAQQSEARSLSSQEVSQSMQETAQVAKELESVVDKFKVTKE